MGEDNRLRTRNDYETDSQYYQDRITHPEWFEPAEEEEAPAYPYLILQCTNCQTIIDENETKPNIALPYDKRVKCPKCGKRKFKVIKTKEEKEKILKQLKLKSKKEKERKEKILSIALYQIKSDIKEIQSDLSGMLEQGKITPKQFASLMHNLIFNEYKYYNRNPDLTLSVSDFDALAKDVASNILAVHDVKEELDDVLLECQIQREQNESGLENLLYLQYSKKMAEESTQGLSLEDEMQGTKQDLTQLDRQITAIEKTRSETEEIKQREQKQQEEKLLDRYDMLEAKKQEQEATNEFDRKIAIKKQKEIEAELRGLAIQEKNIGKQNDKIMSIEQKRKDRQNQRAQSLFEKQVKKGSGTKG